jgi:plastocyanin
MVALGSTVRFTNSDGFAHTVTSISGAQTFPAAEPFDASALQAHGTTLSGGFSSGALQAGSSSQALLADRPGTYLYGCFFHYGAPMRGAIVVQ